MARKSNEAGAVSPREIARAFSTYVTTGSTPNGTKVKSFFSHLEPSLKKLVYNNIQKAYAEHQQAESAKAELLKNRRKEISALKKAAKALGLKVG